MTDPAINTRAVHNTCTERERQNQLWGQQNHNAAMWHVILMEEVGEAAKEIWENEPEKYREEMVQVAAVAIAAIESFDRGNFRNNGDESC